MLTIVRLLTRIEKMQPSQGALSLASAFMKLESLMLNFIQTSPNQRAYDTCWQWLSQSGGAELKAMLFYYKTSQDQKLHSAKYVEAFRCLQYLVNQTRMLMPDESN